MDKKSKHLYEFGPFCLDASERLLLRSGETISITSKSFDLLLVLVEQPGHLLEKEKLINAVWPDSFVEESNLADNIFRLRKVLRDGENGQKFIETVPKRGYRFVAEVKIINGEPTPASQNGIDSSPMPVAAGPATAAPYVPHPGRRIQPRIILGLTALLLLAFAVVWYYRRFNSTPLAESLAVLPFTADPENAYLSDGITESLINNLSRLSNLRVVARTTAFRYKGEESNPEKVGQALNVGTVLTGKVALRDDLLVVQVELVDVATGVQKWGERYQRKLSDIFAVEEDISWQIAEKLRLRLSGEERQLLSKRYTENADVYQLYLQGLYNFSKKTGDGLKLALDYYQRSLAIDPNYALALSALANCYASLSVDEAPHTLLPLARAAALKALDIDPSLAEAHSSLAWIKWTYELDAAGAEAEFERALKLQPNSGDTRYRYARLLADTGRFEEAKAQASQAVALDPLAIQYRKGVPYILYLSRRYDEAIAEYQKVLELGPTFPQARRELGLAYEQKGMYQEAFDQFQKWTELPGTRGRTMVKADIGHLNAVWGKRDEARRALADLLKESGQSYVSAYDIAVVYAGLGETEQAFKWLDKAVGQRPFWLCWLKLDPRLDGLRADSRFHTLLQQVGLAD